MVSLFQRVEKLLEPWLIQDDRGSATTDAAVGFL